MEISLRIIALALGLLCIARSGLAQGKDPLLLARVHHEGVPMPLFEFLNGTWRPAPDSLRPDPLPGLPIVWYQLRPDGPPKEFVAGSVVKMQVTDEDEPFWRLALLLPCGGDTVYPTPPTERIALDSLVPGGAFVVDTSRATLARLQPLLRQLLPDTGVGQASGGHRATRRNASRLATG